jgi:hypothetical protein
LEGYFLLNQEVQRYRSPIHKTAFALTLIKGKEVSGWARDMRGWVANLDPVLQNIPEVWETFVNAFNEQYSDTQAVIRAQAKMDELKMTYPHVDKYITDFEELARKAGYNQTSEETKHHFLQGISSKILEDVLRAPRPTTYAGLKQRAVESTRTKIILEDILKKKSTPYKPPPFRQNFFANRPVTYQSMRPRPPLYNSSNAPPSMRNVPVPMDMSARAQTPRRQNWGQPRAQGRVAQVDAATQQKNPLICFGCGEAGHVVARCPNQEYGRAAQQNFPQSNNLTCFSCGKKGHFAKDCRSKRQSTVNIMDAPEEPLNYPVETPAIPGGRWAKINSLVNELTDDEYAQARATILEQDFQTA